MILAESGLQTTDTEGNDILLVCKPPEIFHMQGQRANKRSLEVKVFYLYKITIHKMFLRNNLSDRKRRGSVGHSFTAGSRT